MSSIGKVVGTIALLLLALVGLAMSLCGGVFTVTSMGASGMVGLLVFSIASLVAGLAVLWIACRRLRGRLGGPPQS
jgi:hypothetical protein